MIILRPSHSLFSAALFFASCAGLSAQCTNVTPYPAASTTPDASGAQTSIDPCNFQIEYATITGIQAGANYEFIMEGGA